MWTVLAHGIYQQCQKEKVLVRIDRASALGIVYL